MLRSLYDWVMGLAARKDAVWVLAAVAFIESSVFPIPPDVLLIPMILAARESAWRYAAVCTIASVLGGMLGYAIGLFLFESAGLPLLEFYGYAAKFEEFRGRYNEWGAWIVFIAGLTPFPYKVITIASGVTELDFAVFSIASVLARGLRFFLVAALLWWLGPPVREFIEKRLGLMTILFCVLLLGGFLVAKYLV
jgi:membrane protein YqaA with SNARE-associated domain